MMVTSMDFYLSEDVKVTWVNVKVTITKYRKNLIFAIVASLIDQLQKYLACGYLAIIL